jgi:hypothetical protein
LLIITVNVALCSGIPIEAVQMHLEVRDHSLMEADLRSALAYLALAHLAAAMLDVAKFEN